jgi:chaperonin GroEL
MLSTAYASLSQEFDDPLILLCDRKVTSAHALLPALELANAQRKKLLLIADSFENEALSMLVLNKMRGIQVCAIKAPEFGNNRKVVLQDLAVLTGAEVISEDLDLKLEDVQLKQLGRAEKVVITQDDTVFLNGGGGKAAINERCELIRESMARSTSEYDKERLQQRLARLAGGVAVLKVGGASEVEVGERKDRITDALNATKAAVEEGIVPGGGVALLYATRNLKNLKFDNFDQNVGVKIITEALKVPCKAIANNAGTDGAVVVGKLLEKEDNQLGYNAQTGVYENMIKAGIIDPTKVVRTALVDAASVASLMTTTEAMVVELPKKDEMSMFHCYLLLLLFVVLC